MPIIFYTKEEHEAELAQANAKGLRLAQALCAAKGTLCVYGPTGRVDGPGEYCDGCPAELDCTATFKRWSK